MGQAQATEQINRDDVYPYVITWKGGRKTIVWISKTTGIIVALQRGYDAEIEYVEKS